MLSLLIHHRVVDYDAWWAVFAEQEIERRANGSRGGRILRNVADANDVLVLLEWDDLERARLFVDSDDLHEGMRRAGVTGEPAFWFLEDVDSTTA